MKKVDWQNSILAEKDLISTVKELKKQNGKPVSVGSISIASQLFRENLIDEFWFAIHPVISRKGPLLFDGIDINTELKFVDSKKLNSGVVVLHYQNKKELRMNTSIYFEIQAHDLDRAKIFIRQFLIGSLSLFPAYRLSIAVLITEEQEEDYYNDRRKLLRRNAEQTLLPVHLKLMILIKRQMR